MTPSNRVLRLVRSVVSIVDPALHKVLVSEFLNQSAANVVVEGLQRLVTDIERPGHRQTYMAVVHLLLGGDGISYARIEEIYRSACTLKVEPLKHVLLHAPPRLSAGVDEVIPDSETRELALGVRKALARSQDRDKLTRLALDPSTPVINILLDNPRVLEMDVVRITARRPNLPEVICEVAYHRKWAHRYEVQQAIVQNPYTPTPLACAFTPFLVHHHLLLVARNNALHEGVSTSASAILAWRGQRRIKES